jgi:molybdopterin biosynthesis enzyme
VLAYTNSDRPQLNEKPFQKLPGSPASSFMEFDAPTLLQLPLQRYEMAYFKTVKVHIDYRAEVGRHRYEVSHALVGQMLEARVTTASLEVMHRGQRVARDLAANKLVA